MLEYKNAMNTRELKKVAKHKYGRIKSNGVDFKPHEYKTVLHLVEYGFDIEFIRPSNVPRSKNPDIEMLGTTWEMKGPEKFNEQTITARFRKAVKQADGKAIFDLRAIKTNRNEAKKHLLSLFKTTRKMRHIIIIESDEKTIDITK